MQLLRILLYGGHYTFYYAFCSFLRQLKRLLGQSLHGIIIKQLGAVRVFITRIGQHIRHERHVVVRQHDTEELIQLRIQILLRQVNVNTTRQRIERAYHSHRAVIATTASRVVGVISVCRRCTKPHTSPHHRTSQHPHEYPLQLLTERMLNLMRVCGIVGFP